MSDLFVPFSWRDALDVLIVMVVTFVHVRGPRSTIERRDAVEAAPVDVTGQQATLSRTVGLLLPEFV